MFRWAIAFFILANMGYFAWLQGWLAPLGMEPYTQSEAWRLEQQVQPEAVLVQAPPVATAPSVPEPEPVAPPLPTPAPSTLDAEQAQVEAVETVAAPEPEAIPPQPEVPATTAQASEPPPPAEPPEPAPALLCLQAGTFTEEQSKTLRNALRGHSLPPGTWELLPQTVQGRWMVYLSQPSAEAANKRRLELHAQKIDVDRAGGRLDPGLSLGRFSSEEAATRELTRLVGIGLRGARVVQERPSTTLYTLRVDGITAEQRASLRSLNAALAGNGWKRCQ